RIAPELELIYDTATFSELVQDSAIAPTAEAQGLLAQAVDLYQNTFLTSVDDNLAWIQKRRQELSQTYSEALIALGKILEQSGEKQGALGLFIRASVANPQREDVAGSIMTIYRDAGEYQNVLDTYERLEKRIAANLKISPAKWLQELAEEIHQKAKVK